MSLSRADVLECRAFIRNVFNQHVPIGILTGTGLSESPEGLEEICRFDYHSLPKLPAPTTAGHKGKLIIGRIRDRHVIVMQGRFHLYEGYTAAQVAWPVRLMQEMGVGTLIVNNAAGGINPEYSAGDLMLISDHINLTGQNPLAGPNQDEWGIRFPDMTRAYDPGLLSLAAGIARQHTLPFHKGVYAGLQGPSLETPAEIRFLKTIGSDAVGMSTVTEVISAVHAGMNILGISLITNINDPDHPGETTLEAVLDIAGKSVPRLNRLLSDIIKAC